SLATSRIGAWHHLGSAWGRWRMTQASSSWPSANTSASTETRSPTTRLIGYRPQSISGSTRSMTTLRRASIISHGKPFSLNLGDRPALLRWSSTALGNSLAGGGLGCGSEMADSIEHIRGYYEARGESEWHRLALPFDGALEWELHRRTFERLLPAGARVLDLGGGPGRWTLWLAERGHRVVLADLSPRMLD